MILCITEKPSVAQTISKILNANQRHQGYFEGNGYWVSWTYGHLCTLKDPSDYNAVWKHWSLGALPMIPERFGIKLINDAGIKSQFKVLEDLILKCDEIINCGDAGQEGELIQRWVMQKARCKKPVKRLWISSLTDEAIKEGFNNLKPEKDFEPLYMAGLCRAIGDWILGINATRLYTLKYSPQRGQILSLGRVQTPTLAMIVNRQREIEQFVPKDTWELKTRYRDVVFSSTLKGFDDKEKAEVKLKEIEGSTFEVTDIQEKNGSEHPPKLMDLTSLQVECNKKFGFSADETLRIIQKLYERKVTTYPRVDTTYLPEDMYPKCGGILNSLTDYQDLLQNIRGKKLKKSKKVFDNSKITDHHAIVPTGVQLPSDLDANDRKVFDVVARHFIAAFFPECKFKQTTVKGKADKVEFKTTGKVILDEGWKVVFATATGRNETNNDEDNVSLPSFTKGESGPHQPFLAKKTSQPPKYFTEATLLRAMESAGSFVEDEELREALKANGIGRPSTRAAIIEILFKRGYIYRERKSLKASQAGIDLITLIKEELLTSPRLTGIWEGRLRAIERGDYSPAEFISQLKEMIYIITRSVMTDSSNRRVQTVVLDKKEAKSKSKSSKTTRKKTQKKDGK